MAESATSSSSISVASTTSSPGPSVSQRGSFRRTASSSTLGGGSPGGPFASRPRAFSNASSLTLGSNNAGPSHTRPFKARRLPTKPVINGASSVLASTITENDVLQQVTRPDQVDLLALSDDSIPSLFVRFGVRDVRSIQELARTQASTKQQELRSMVGERYRDLLGAADSIVRMRTSSRHLLEQLSQARQDCTRDQMQRRTRTFSRQRLQSQTQMPSKPETSSSPAHHSLAMLIKLLLDVPEHIWRALEVQDCLSAARLVTLGRVVYRELATLSLSGEEEDEVAEEERSQASEVFRAFPLVERQWESLAQLNTQVVRRAKATLQRWDLSMESAAQTLAAILLLDNTPLDSLLETLLAQRQTALTDLLDEPQSTSTLPLDVQTRVSEALSLIANTLDQAEQLMQPDSLLLATVDQLQTVTIASIHVQGQQEPALLAPIIDKLPNAHLLLRYLPDTVTSFTPFINSLAPLSTEHIGTALSAWFTTAQDCFGKALTQGAAESHDAASLSAFKRSLDQFLSSHSHLGFAGSLQEYIQESLLVRLEVLYKVSLDRLVQTVHQEWTTDLDESAAHATEASGAAYLFHELSLPDAGAFDALDRTLQKRLNGRSPLLDKCLSRIEELCDHLHNDLSSWFGSDLLSSTSARQSLLSNYRQSLENSLQTLLHHFEAFMDSGLPPLLMARLWLALASDPEAFARLSSFDPSLDQCLALVNTGLEGLKEKALQLWLSESLEGALSPIQSLMDTKGPRRMTLEPDYFSTHSEEGKSILLASQPTPGTFQACLHLAQRAEQLDEQVRQASPALTTELLKAFQQRWLDSVGPVDASQLDTSCASAVLWDHAFLATLSPWEANETWRDTLCTQADTDWSTFHRIAKPGLDAFVTRTQNLFSSLRTAQSSMANSTSTDKASVLLPLGAPVSTSNAKAISGPTKLGARFGLLPVSSL